jgi:hypothetical protein
VLARSDEALQVTVEGYDGAIFFSVYRPAAPELLDILLRPEDGQEGRVLDDIRRHMKMHGMKLAEIRRVCVADPARAALPIGKALAHLSDRLWKKFGNPKWGTKTREWIVVLQPINSSI